MSNILSLNSFFTKLNFRISKFGMVKSYIGQGILSIKIGNGIKPSRYEMLISCNPFFHFIYMKQIAQEKSITKDGNKYIISLVKTVEYACKAFCYCRSRFSR